MQGEMPGEFWLSASGAAAAGSVAVGGPGVKKAGAQSATATFVSIPGEPGTYSSLTRRVHYA